MNVKELFEKAENGVLSYDQFKQFASEGNAKFVDLGEGGYVAKNKYSDDLAAKDTQIETLKGDISKRDEDLKGLQSKLAAANGDVDKLNQVTTELSSLQSKYEADMNAFKEKISKQTYEFAVKEFANTKNFTSNAAKRDFINEMVSKGLQLSDEGNIMGADDFAKEYSEANADAFVVENPQDNTPKKPSFAATTPGLNDNKGETSPFHFNFQGVRSRPEDK